MLAGRELVVEDALLGEVAEARAHGDRVARRVDPAHADRARVRPEEAHEDLRERALAGSVEPEEPERLALRHRQGHALEGADRAVALLDGRHFDGGAHVPPPSGARSSARSQASAAGRWRRP